MSRPLPLRSALKRGALVTAANWPVVLVDFAIESLYKVTVAVPIIGGAVMVGALIGADLGEVLGVGLRSTAETVFGFLAAAPAALLAFLTAVSLVALGGAMVMFAIKSATLAILVRGEQTADDLQRLPVDPHALQSARAFGLGVLLDAGTHFARRAVALALTLGAAYAVIGSMYVFIVTVGVGGRSGPGFSLWPLVVVMATSGGVVALTLINLAFDLVRVIVLTDDCGVSTAIVRLRRFVIDDARQVVGIFAVMWAIGLVATAIALLATAGTTLVASMPFIGLLVVPLQSAAWLVRGLVFQFLSLASLSAYQSQYRRYTDSRR